MPNSTDEPSKTSGTDNEVAVVAGTCSTSDHRKAHRPGAFEVQRLPTAEAEAVTERMRKLVDAALNGTEPSASPDASSQTQPCADAIGATPKAAPEQSQPDNISPEHSPVTEKASDHPVMKPKTGDRPMWALTEDEAEAMEAAEEDRLLGFAEQLDIDALAEELSDAELAEAMQVWCWCQIVRMGVRRI